MGALEHYNSILKGAEPNYIGAKGKALDDKIKAAEDILCSCELCERRCGVDRLAGQKGHCGVLDARISSMFDHWGEERVLVPSYTIFFSGCTFDCVFCQNWDISTNPKAGSKLTPRYVAEVLEEKAGTVKNANWVGGDPTPNLLFILQTLRECNARLAQIWNSNMYLTEQSMALLDGIIDLYLTDFKYGPGQCAETLSNVKDYWRITTRNHLLAAAQCDVIVRHLVMPGHVDCCTKPIMGWLAQNLRKAKVNVMDQYRPEHHAFRHPEINRMLKRDEFAEAVYYAKELDIDVI